MNGDFKVTTATEPGPNDVVFDCADCGRSLCIDKVAAGFEISCPHCGLSQKVPGEPQLLGPEEEIAPEETLLLDEAGQLRMRNVELENHLAAQQARLEQISREMGLIQAAIDRINGLMQDAQIPPVPLSEG